MMFPITIIVRDNMNMPIDMTHGYSQSQLVRKGKSIHNKNLNCTTSP